MKFKVKKFFKWFGIIFLIVASVAATVFIFFKKYNENQVKEVNLINVLNSSEKTKFDNGFASVLSAINKTEKANWFEEVKIANDNLDDSLRVLSYYYMETDGLVKDREISSTYSSMITTRSTLTDMFNEYAIKSTSSYFPKLVGANDIFMAYSNYLVKYAKFVKAVNQNLTNRDGFILESDVKFCVIDLYSRIVVDTFSNPITDGDLKVLESETNINEIDKHFKFNHSYIDDADVLSINAIRFIENYNACNKEAFADNFVQNLNSATGFDENSTREIKAAFYFNELFVK